MPALTFEVFETMAERPYEIAEHPANQIFADRIIEWMGKDDDNLMIDAASEAHRTVREATRAIRSEQEAQLLQNVGPVFAQIMFDPNYDPEPEPAPAAAAAAAAAPPPPQPHPVVAAVPPQPRPAAAASPAVREGAAANPIILDDQVYPPRHPSRNEHRPNRPARPPHRLNLPARPPRHSHRPAHRHRRTRTRLTQRQMRTVQVGIYRFGDDYQGIRRILSSYATELQGISERFLREHIARSIFYRR